MPVDSPSLHLGENRGTLFCSFFPIASTSHISGCGVDGFLHFRRQSWLQEVPSS